MQIPRVIHRIWLGKEAIPKALLEFEKSWTKHHPNWTVKLWTDNNRPNLLNEKLFTEAQSPNERSNILRYEILQQFGGLYVDTDVESLKPIDPLIQDETFFAGMLWNGLVCNALIGAIPHHPTIDAVVAGLSSQFAALPPPICSDLRSGSHYFDQVLREQTGVKLFPPEIFYPYGPYERWKRYSSFPGAYAVHHWSLSEPQYSTRASRRKPTSTLPLSVVILPSSKIDAMRLEWSLNGLIAQTVSDFNVVFLPTTDESKISVMKAAAKHMTCVWSQKKVSDPYALDEVLLLAQGKRVLFLQENCVPDSDLIALHSQPRKQPAVLTSPVRRYPGGFVFPFPRPWQIDYEGLRRNSQAGVYSDIKRTDRFGTVSDSARPVSFPRSVIDKHGGGYDIASDSIVKLMADCLGREHVRVLRHQPPSATVLSLPTKRETDYSKFWRPIKADSRKHRRPQSSAARSYG